MYIFTHVHMCISMYDEPVGESLRFPVIKIVSVYVMEKLELELQFYFAWLFHDMEKNVWTRHNRGARVMRFSIEKNMDHNMHHREKNFNK